MQNSDLDLIIDCEGTVKIEKFGNKIRLVIGRIEDKDILDAVRERQELFRELK